jgi:SMC interacting uncharacterized protein involved in chromosome segregation
MAESPFTIDLNALDWECQQQPALVHRFSQALAEAKRELEEMEKKFKSFREKASAAVRRNPGKYKIMKVTNDAIATAVANHEKYAEFVASIAELNYNVEMAWADVHAINSKQQSLTDLVKLHGQSYFDSPRLTKEGVESILKDKARKKGGVKRDE